MLIRCGACFLEPAAVPHSHINPALLGMLEHVCLSQEQHIQTSKGVSNLTKHILVRNMMATVVP